MCAASIRVINWIEFAGTLVLKGQKEKLGFCVCFPRKNENQIEEFVTKFHRPLAKLGFSLKLNSNWLISLSLKKTSLWVNDFDPTATLWLYGTMHTTRYIVSRLLIQELRKDSEETSRLC